MRGQSMKTAVLFDLDGTLWDSVPQVTEGFNRALARRKELNCRITEAQLRSWMGLDRVRLAAAMLPMLPPEARDEVMEECFQEELAWLRQCPGQPYPHLIQTLERLSREHFLGIVSNCQAGYIEAFLTAAGAERYISDHECFASGRSKGENIRRVMERNGICRAVYLGDTQGDLEAADQAGIPFIHAAYGFGTVDRETPAIKSLDCLPPVAERLLAEGTA